MIKNNATPESIEIRKIGFSKIGLHNFAQYGK